MCKCRRSHVYLSLALHACMYIYIYVRIVMICQYIHIIVTRQGAYTYVQTDNLLAWPRCPLQSHAYTHCATLAYACVHAYTLFTQHVYSLILYIYIYIVCLSLSLRHVHATSRHVHAHVYTHMTHLVTCLDAIAQYNSLLVMVSEPRDIVKVSCLRKFKINIHVTAYKCRPREKCVRERYMRMYICKDTCVCVYAYA